MKTLFVIGIGVVIGWFLFAVPSNKAAMDKCQLKYSYSTCVYTLR